MNEAPGFHADTREVLGGDGVGSKRPMMPHTGTSVPVLGRLVVRAMSADSRKQRGAGLRFVPVLSRLVVGPVVGLFLL